MKKIAEFLPGWALSFAGGALLADGQILAGGAIVLAGFTLPLLRK
jgi:hypothetical protein